MNESLILYLVVAAALVISVTLFNNYQDWRRLGVKREWDLEGTDKLEGILDSIKQAQANMHAYYQERDARYERERKQWIEQNKPIQELLPGKSEVKTELN